MGDGPKRILEAFLTSSSLSIGGFILPHFSGGFVYYIVFYLGWVVVTKYRRRAKNLELFLVFGVFALLQSGQADGSEMTYNILCASIAT